MKWLFGLLLLVNIGALMWARWHHDVPVGEAWEARAAVHPELVIPLNQTRVAPQARPPGAPGPRDSLVSAAPPPPPPPATRCYRLGPIDAANQVASLGAALTGRGLSYIQRNDTVRAESGYWVHLPPAASRAAAEARLRELRKAGVKDIYIAPDKGQDHTVSLGVFKERDNAERRLRELTARGIKARLDTRFEVRTRHWLEVQSVEANDSVIDALRALAGPAVAVAEGGCAAGVADNRPAGAPEPQVPPAAPVSPPAAPK